MRFKSILALLLAALFLPCALADDRDSLRAAWQEAAALRTDASPYLEVPEAGSFIPGALTEEKQQDALACLNFLRSLAGLDPVKLNPVYTLRAQNGALLLAANDQLEHDSPRPEGMDEAQYETAHMGTSLGNIAKFNWMKPDILIDGVTYFARDDGDSNLSLLGHRRWLLNPAMAETGFGLANSQSGMSYVTMYAVDDGNADTQWDHVAWPCAGAFPVEMMRAELAWSVSLNDAEYDSAASDIHVYLKEETSGAEFAFHPGKENPDGYCILSTEACGSGDCIIFRPDIGEKGISEYVQNQVWSVCISGLTGADGADKEIRYTVEMASLYPQEVSNIELSQTEALLSPGEPLQLSAAVIPGYADDLSVIWESSDPQVATVGKSGMVLAVAPGSCTITASSANGRSDSCILTVE